MLQVAFGFGWPACHTRALKSAILINLGSGCSWGLTKTLRVPLRQLVSFPFTRSCSLTGSPTISNLSILVLDFQAHWLCNYHDNPVVPPISWHTNCLAGGLWNGLVSFKCTVRPRAFIPSASKIMVLACSWTYKRHTPPVRCNPAMCSCEIILL